MCELGRGGMGVVYLAEHMHIDKKFAVKGLSVKYTDDQNFRQLLQRLYIEGKNQALLDHPNIVQITDLYDEQGQYFLVMEYVEGEDLGELIRRKGILSEKEALTIIKGILSGLGFAHRKGMIHRDIKPSNVMVGNDGRVRIMDFGLSILAGEARLTIDGSETALTPWYASPEQITEPKKVDHRSDVYSLGIVFFEMLTGRVPFEGEPYSVTHQQVTAPLPDPTGINPGVSKELSRIVLKCVAKNPDKRFQGCDEFLKTIIAYEKSKEPKKGPGWKPWLFGVTAIAVLCVAMLITITKDRTTSGSASEPEVVRQAVAALVQNSVNETATLCKSIKALPRVMGNLKIAEEMNNLELASKYRKNAKDLNNNLNTGIKEFNDITKQLREYPEETVTEELKKYLEGAPAREKQVLAGRLLNYFNDNQTEIKLDEFHSVVCPE
jgi:serine/threonine protein kinase